MKPKLLFSVCIYLTAVFSIFSFVTVQGSPTQYQLSLAEYQVNIFGNDYKDESFPILNYQGRTYAPMRSMLEAAGFEVDFSNGVATVKSGGTPNASNPIAIQTAKKDYVLTNADYKVIINGKDYQDDDYPILNYEGRTYAPMRSMLEAAGLKVDFSNGIATVETAEAALSNAKTKLSVSVCWEHYDMEKAAKLFEQIHPDVEIVVNKTPEGNTDTVSKLEAGTADDIIDGTGLDYAQLAQKGLLAGFYPLMDNDSSFIKENYYTNVFDAMDFNEELYLFPVTFAYDMVSVDGGEKVVMTKYDYFLPYKEYSGRSKFVPNTDSNGKAIFYPTMRFCINNKSQNKELAWEFIKFLTTPAAIEGRAVGNYFSVNKRTFKAVTSAAMNEYINDLETQKGMLLDGDRQKHIDEAISYYDKCNQMPMYLPE